MNKNTGLLVGCLCGALMSCSERPGAIKPASAEVVTTENLPIKKLELKDGERIALIGAGLGSRMIHFGEFETEMHLRYPQSKLFIRNLRDEGNTPGFRPHPGRKSPWAFPGAEKFQHELAKNTGSSGHFETPDQWLTRLKADTIIAFFGFNSAFEKGEAGIDTYKAELKTFLEHTLAQKYNGNEAPKVALVSPTAFEDLSQKFDTPEGKAENHLLAKYTEAMKQVAHELGVHFVDAYTPSKGWYQSSEEDLTIDGALLNAGGYKKFASFLADSIFGKKEPNNQLRKAVQSAVMEKNFMWSNDYKVPNGVHVYGRRYEPFGPQNYPDETRKHEK